MTFVHPSAEVHEDSKLENGVKIWRFAIIQSHAEIGENSIIGSHVYIGEGVRIGSNCKIQNGAQIFEGSKIGDGVFIGPGVILTNDKVPRAVTDQETLKSNTDWLLSSVEVSNFASIGAGALCIAPVKIGEWALIGAGSIVTKSIKSFEYGFGNPYKNQGWIGRSGERLVKIQGTNSWLCPISKKIYVESFLNEDIHLIEI
jgi:acetyltransferase-like isoleucine patch superfamily enzyme